MLLIPPDGQPLPTTPISPSATSTRTRSADKIAACTPRGARSCQAEPSHRLRQRVSPVTFQTGKDRLKYRHSSVNKWYCAQQINRTFNKLLARTVQRFDN